MKSFVSLQEWVVQQQTAAVRNREQDVLSAFHHYFKAWECRFANPIEALSHYQQAQQLTAISHPHLSLFFQAWCVETYRSYLYDYQMALDLALRLIVELRKHPNTPFAGMVYTSAVQVQLAIDPFYYGAQVEEMLNYIDEHVPLMDGSYALSLYCRMLLALARDDADTSLHYANQCFEFTLQHSTPNRPLYFASGAANTLGYLHYQLGNWTVGNAHAQQAEKLARASRNDEKIAASLYWQALYAHLREDYATSETYYQAAETCRQRLEHALRPFYFPLVSLLLRRGETEQIAPIIEGVIALYQRSGERYGEAIIRLRYCLWLGQMGQLTTPELEKARESATRLQQPAHILAKLERIAQGDYQVRVL